MFRLICEDFAELRGMKFIEQKLSNDFIAGSSKCSTKPLSTLLTKLLTHIK